MTKGNRKKRRELITDKIKFVRALESELYENYYQQAKLGYIVLDKPLRDGWYRTFTLRNDIRNHKKADVFLEILNKVVVKIWGREKKSSDKRWQHEFRKYNQYYQNPGIKYLREGEYAALSTAAKKFFVQINQKFNYRYTKKYYCVLPKYYFVTTYQRAYITRRRVISSELKARADEIKNILLHKKYYKYSLNNSSKYFFYHDPHRKQRRKANMYLQTFDLENLEKMPYKLVEY